ncbi:MAG: FAD-dependent oxidoreductase [Terracidiphilus sp.]
MQELYTARLVHKNCLSETAQTFHFEFVFEELSDFCFTPGQFVTAVVPDHNGKMETRAYSLASAPKGNRFELCVNRVEGGYFSNYLADLTDLNVHETIQVYGPNGFFTLREPLTDSIFVATGTGIAPIRGFMQWLFPDNGADRSQGREIWLVYGTRHETELYYREEFEALAAAHPNFHYLPTLSRASENWTGLRGYVQDHVAGIVEQRAARLGPALPLAPPDASIPAAQLRFEMVAYICGLSPMVTSVRQRLAGFGWHRKQMIFERYD